MSRIRANIIPGRLQPTNLHLQSPIGLKEVPRNVKYEENTYIDLEFISASIFMPWTWIRVKDLPPKNASIEVFAKDFSGDITYVIIIIKY